MGISIPGRILKFDFLSVGSWESQWRVPIPVGDGLLPPAPELASGTPRDSALARAVTWSWGGGWLDSQGSAGLETVTSPGPLYILTSSFIFCSERLTFYFST